MDLRRLRTFVSIVEQGTVSKASLQLRIAQPALSRQIHDLEEELGVRLFDRVRRRLVLTGEGERLLGHCRTVLGAVGSLSEQAQLLRRGDSGILRVGATPQTIEGVFSSFLHCYAERRPKVRIKLSEAIGDNQVAMLERGEIHVVIGFKRAIDTKGDAIESFDLSPIEFLAACPDSLKLGTGGNVDIGALAAHPLLLLDPSFWVRTTFDAACRLAGVKPDIFVESRAPHALLALAEAGHGVAIVPSVLPTHRYRLRILRITHRRRPLRETLAVLWDKRRPLPPYAKDFCESLAAHVREVFPVSQPRARTLGSLQRVVRPRTAERR
jgi:DNA-binding transcriptional LysR family regulator